MSKIRNKLIATLTIFAMLFTSLSAVMFAGSNFAKAEGEESVVVGVFQLQDGASSGYIDEEEKNFAGLRWETKINKAYYNSLTANDETLEFGTLIAPAEFEDYLNFDPNADKKIVFEDGDWYIDGITNKKGEKIYVSNIVNEYAVSNLKSYEDEEAGTDDLSGEYIMRSAIRYEDFEDANVNIKDGYATELVAKAYVKITNGETATYIYSEADTVRSLRNSVAYNLAAGNFSEADATSLKKFAVEGDIIDASSDALFASNTQYAFFNVGGENDALDKNTVVFPELIGKDVEFIINSKSAEFDSATGTVTFGAVDANNDPYIGAFIDDDFYYKKLTVAKAISTAEEFVKTFSFGSDDNVAETISDLYDLPNFSGHYVLANNIDFTNKTMPNDNFTYIDVQDDKRPIGVGLTGTFDGQGYVISNLVVPNGGVFGVLNGTLKNVKFDNITSNATSVTGMICNLTYTDAKVDSIYLTTSTTATHNLFSYRSYSGTVVTNSLFIGELQFETGATTIQDVYKKYTYGMYSPSSEYVVISSKTLDSYCDAVKNGSSHKITASGASKYLPVGKAYRYLSMSELVDVYNNGVYTYDGVEVDMSVQKENLTAMLNAWDKTYFDISEDGRIAWKNDYSLYQDNILVSGNIIELNTVDNKQTGLSIKDELGNVIQEGFDYSIINEDDENPVVTLEGVTITANNPGNATLVVSKDGVIYFTVTIKVNKQVIDYSDKTVTLDADGEEITIINEEILDVSVEAEEVTANVVDNKVTLVGATADNETKYLLNVETKTAIYKVNAKYVTAYIKTAEEFVSIFSLGKDDSIDATSFEELAVFDGYYMLANDINFEGNKMFTEIMSYHPERTGTPIFNVNPDVGLTKGSTFDGNGYTIKNIVVPQGGLFGAVSGTVKNLAVINFTFDKTSYEGVFGKITNRTAVYENIYMEYNGSETPISSLSFLTHYFDRLALVSNCYFVGNINMARYSTDSGTSTYNHLGNDDNKLIIVTKSFVSGRSNSTTRVSFGTHVGSQLDNILSSDGYVQDNNAPGKTYRYLSLSDMLAIYNDTEGTCSQTPYLQALLKDKNHVDGDGLWDYTYFNFDATNGMTWKGNN